MNKRNIKNISIFLLIFALCCALSLCFIACNNVDKPTLNDLTAASADDDYQLKLQFFSDNNNAVTNEAIVTKREIKDIYKIKPVILDKFKSSEKAEYHSLKGVYLDDILLLKNIKNVCADFGGLQFISTDNHNPKIPKGAYDTSNGGSKIIIGLEYDGNVLNETGKSGALRAFLPNQANATWTKNLCTIKFVLREAVRPTPTKLYILQTLDNLETLKTSKEYSKIDSKDNNITHYYQGISIEELKLAKILNYTLTDDMTVMCWDFDEVTDNFKWVEATYYGYDSYSTASICYKTKTELTSPWVDVEKGPVFDGVDISNGLKRSNFASLAIKDTALMNIAKSYEARAYKASSDVMLDKILEEVNMWEIFKTNYVLSGLNNEQLTLTAEQVKTVKIVKNGENYAIVFGETTFTLKTVEKITFA